MKKLTILQSLIFGAIVFASDSAKSALALQREERPFPHSSALSYRPVADSAPSSDEETAGATVHSEAAGNTGSSSGSGSTRPNVPNPINAEKLKWGATEYDWDEHNRRVDQLALEKAVKRAKERRADRQARAAAPVLVTTR